MSRDNIVEKGEGTAIQPDRPAAISGPGFNLSSEEAALADSLASGGLELYEIDRLIEPTMSDEEAFDLPLFRALFELGEPVARRILRLGDGAILSVVIATEADSDELASALSDPFYRLSPRLVAASVPGAAPPPPEPLPSVRLPRILVVDDEDISLYLCQRLAAGFGRVSTATDAPEAVSAFEQALSSDPFQVVMLDIVLPSASGHEVLAAFRRLERENGTALGEGAKVIMVSAKGDYDNVSAAFRAEADAYVVKPVSRDRVDAAFARLGYGPLAIALASEAP